MSEIVEDYRQSLNELTFNSRPIIDTLTTIAAENKNVADGILNAITSRIYRCLPEQKLFTLYLLDSICKNIGNPYNVMVGGEIFKLFSDTYLLVDDVVRGKLKALYNSWTTTKTKVTGLPLFPVDELDKIGNFLSKAARSNGGSSAAVSGSVSGPILSNAQLIKDIDELIPIFHIKLNSNSNDTKSQEKFKALNQLKMVLQSQQMQPNDLKAVQNQLNIIKQQELNRSDSSSNNSTPTLPQRVPTSLPNLPNLPNVPKQVAQTHQPPQTPQKTGPDEVFDQLIHSGIITYEQDFNGPKIYDINYPKSVTGEMTSDTLLSQVLSNQMMRSEYDQAKFNELNKLKLSDTQSFITNTNVSIQCKNLLYETKGLKCSVCGKRFNNDDTGRNRKKMHLDWHFRINKKIQTSHNVQSRNWFLDDYEWVKFKDENLLEFQVEASALEQQQQQQALLPKEIPYVIIPGDETNMNNKCLICREQVKGTFNEDIGEWCWYNCIIQPGENKNSRKIVHANCYSETRKRNAPDDLNGSIKRERF